MRDLQRLIICMYSLSSFVLFYPVARLVVYIAIDLWPPAIVHYWMYGGYPPCKGLTRNPSIPLKNPYPCSRVRVFAGKGTGTLNMTHGNTLAMPYPPPGVVHQSFAYARSAVHSVATRDRKSTRLNSSHSGESRMPSSA